MSSIKHRLEKLERALNETTTRPVLFVHANEADGEKAVEDAKAKAVAAWEAKNGPIGYLDDVVFFMTIYEEMPKSA